jgi:general secretion pathway protein E
VTLVDQMADTGKHLDFEALSERGVSRAIEEGFVSQFDVENAKKLAETSEASVLQLLNQMGLVSDEQVAGIYSELTGIEIAEAIDPDKIEPSNTIDRQFYQSSGCFFLAEQDTLLVVDPIDDRALRGATFALKRRPRAIKIIPRGTWQGLMQAYDRERLTEHLPTDLVLDDLSADLTDQSRDAPIVRRVAAWLSEAANQRASDIHFDTRRDKLDIQYRIDGQLKTVASEAKANAASIIARIKVIAGLDLGERYKSQDGRANIVVRGRRLDVRVSIIPTIEGESAVIRILDRPDGMLSLEALGFQSGIVDSLESILKQRHGLFVVAGPTGSGKTTTLYACLESLKNKGLKILSVEDPVEFQFTHVNQVQVSEKAGTSFAGALRSFLRHDPNVIMVGEIRDSETAKTAVQAALTGHLVLATIHAIDTPRVRTRLIDMGVEAFRLDACLSGALAQRLIRKLCSSCKTAESLTDMQRALFERVGAETPENVYIPEGCSKCNQTGFLGRQVVSEFSRSGEGTVENGLNRSALELVAQGVTSLGEIADLVS